MAKKLKKLLAGHVGDHDALHKEHEASRKEMHDRHGKALGDLHKRHQKERAALHAEFLKGEKDTSPLHDNPRSQA